MYNSPKNFVFFPKLKIVSKKTKKKLKYNPKTKSEPFLLN